MSHKKKLPVKGFCIECGEMIEECRSGRKFCCERCKNRYNYRVRINREHYAKMTVEVLLRNYYVLDLILERDIHTVNLAKLLCMGFNPDYSTVCLKFDNHSVMRCFDISYKICGTKVCDILRLEASQMLNNKMVMDNNY